MPSKKSSITVRLDSDDEIADQAWQIEGIKQARKSLKEDKGVDFDATVKKLRSKIKRQGK